MKAVKTTTTVLLLTGLSACIPPSTIPSVLEPLDSAKWKRCAEELGAREERAMLDDLTLDGKTLICQGAMLAGEGKTDKSIERLTEAGVRNKEDHRPHYLAGRVLAEAGRYEESLSAFERSFDRNPKMAVPSERLGWTILDKEGKEAAIAFLKAAHKRKLCPYGCQGLLARLCRETGKSEAAAQIYNEMVRLDPAEPAAYVGLAGLENVAKAHDKEAAKLEQAIAAKNFAKIDKTQKADIYYSLAFARYNSQAYDQAAKAIEEAILLNPNRADWHLLAGWIDLKGDRPAQALVNFESAAKMDPNLAAIHIGRGDAQMAISNYSEARAAFERAQEIDAGNGIIMLKRAHAALKEGDVEEGKKLFEQAISLGDQSLPQELVETVTALLPKEEPAPGTTTPPAPTK